jgi:hypothetical protein
VSFDERAITVKALEKAQGRMKDTLVRIFTAYPDVVQHGVAALATPVPTARQLRDERRQYEGIEDPEEFARVYAEKLAQSSPSEARDMITPGRWDIQEPERLF